MQPQPCSLSPQPQRPACSFSPCSQPMLPAPAHAPTPSPCFHQVPAPVPSPSQCSQPQPLLPPSPSRRPSPSRTPASARNPAPTKPQPQAQPQPDSACSLSPCSQPMLQPTPQPQPQPQAQLINSSIVHYLEIVEAIRLDLENFKAEYTSEHIASLLAYGSTEPVGSQPSSKRQRRLPGYLTNSVVTTRLPQFRALIVDIIGVFKSELDGRFSSSNVGICDSFQSLSPQFDKEKFLDQQRLDKLLVYAMNVPALKSPSGEGRLGDDVTEARHDLKAECRIYKRSLLSAFESIPLN